MKRSTIWAVVLLLGISLLGILFIAPQREANASALSRHADGLLAARRYLEHEGTRITLRDLPFDQKAEAVEEGSPAVWVLAFPWQRELGADELPAIEEHLRAGGTVLLAYSRTLSTYQEERVIERLGMDRRTLERRPSLLPWIWWAKKRQIWELVPGDSWPDLASAPTLAMPAARFLPEAPAKSAVLYLHRTGATGGTARDVPVVFSYPRQRGRVVVLPATLFSNGFLLESDHADFLLSLRDWLGDSWSFDEYHHGLVNVDFAAQRASTFAWDLFMIHLVIFYLLGFLALARRFGPPWREPRLALGSTSSFLKNLGALHRELRHHPAAARLLRERLDEWNPSGTGLPADDPPVDVKSDRELLELAREMMQHTRRKRYESAYR